MISDKFRNKVLRAYNKILRKFRERGRFDYSGFRLTADHDFTRMSRSDFFSLYRSGQAWGDYHPADLHQWYDPEAIKLGPDGVRFSITQNQKVVTTYIIDQTGKPVDGLPPTTIPFGIGIASSLEPYGYGLYEWNMKLPKASIMWLAAWLSAVDSWPPEIDPIEAYSTPTLEYGDRLETNIHCGDSKREPGLHYDLGGHRHGHLVDTSKPFNLKCDFREESIKIYYNDFLVRVLTDKKHMDWFKDKKMVNIMGTGIDKMSHYYHKSNYKDMSNEDLLFTSFKFYEHNK